jgi:hypothetical protein
LSNYHHLTGLSKKLTMAKREKSNLSVCSRTEQFTKVNGLLMRIRKTEEEYKFGQMDLGTMDSGEMEWQMDTEDSFMPRVTCMKESGLKIKPMDMVFTLILMEVDMRVNGSKINNTDSVSSNGQMVLSMRDNMSKV